MNLRSIIFIVVLFLAPIFVEAQNDVYTITKIMPEFPGGTTELAKFLIENVQYPAEARETYKSGKAYVNFIVDTSGQITSPKIIKSAGLKCLDDEALRVVKSMPKWNPGSDSIKKVSVSMNLPISFKSSGPIENYPTAKRSPEEQAKHESAMEQWNKGHNLENKFLFDQALEYYNKCLAIEPNSEYALFDKGKMLMVLGKKNDACEIWSKMIQSNIRKEAAEDYVKKYCKIENGPEEMVKYYNGLKANNFFENGMAEARNGRYEAALKRFDSCLVYKPEHYDGLFNKAVMHYKLDQKNAACRTWNRLLTVKPDDEQTKELVKKHCN